MIYYHNPKCSKSRKGLDLLLEHVSEIDVKFYLKEPLSIDELLHIMASLKDPILNLIREKECVGLGIQFIQRSPIEWAKLIVQYPLIMQRPVFLIENKAMIGRPIQRLLEII